MMRRRLPALVTPLIFVLAYAVAALQFPGLLSMRVLGDLLTDNAFLGVLAVGMTVVVISGGIDLSVGAVAALTGVVLAVMVERWGLSPLLAFTLVLPLGAGMGALVGLAIHTFKAPPFIATLTAMFLARGLCLLIADESIAVRHPTYDQLAGMSFPIAGGGLTLLSLVMLGAFVVGGLVLHATRFGADVYAVGGDPRSAELMGVPMRRTTVLVYAFSSFMAALAGVVFSIYTQSGNSLALVGVELDAIAAVVVGGTLLIGGAGGVFGSLFGVLIQGLILTYITFDGRLSSWWAKIVIGLLLFAFIAAQKLATSGKLPGSLAQGTMARAPADNRETDSGAARPA